MTTVNQSQGRTWAVIATAALLVIGAGTGCASVRRAREAQKTDQIPAGQRTLTAAEIGLSSNSILTLDDALRIALAYHPAVAQASQNVAIAVAQVREARSGYGPTVNANASYGRASSNTKDAPDSGKSSDSYRAGLELDLLVYDFGKTPAAVRQAIDRRVAAESSLRAARNDVAYNVRSAFFNLGKAQELLQVAEEAVRQYEAHLEQVKAFSDLGRLTRYDVTKSEVDLGNARLNLIVARADGGTARAALNRALGLAEEPGYQIRGAAFEEYAGQAEDLMAVARQQHPDMITLKAEERVASSAVDAAIADLYPSLNLSAGYSAAGAVFPLIRNWSATLQSAVQLFGGSAKTAKIDEAAAQLRIARSRMADREQQLYLDLNTALSQRDSARQRVELTALTSRSAAETLDLIQERYRRGKASAVELTDAQVALTGAKADEVKARFEYQAAVAQIKHAIGEE